MTPKRPAADSKAESRSASKTLKPKPKREPDSDSSSPSPDEDEDDDSPPKKKSRKQTRIRPTKADGSQMHRRSREGCYTCRVRRKKCDEALPICGACSNLHLKCEYDTPAWWKNAELRKRHKDNIKSTIRTTRPQNLKSKANPPQQLPLQRTPVPLQSTPMMPPPSADTPPPSLTHSMPTSSSTNEHFQYTSRSSFDPSTTSPPFQLDTPQSHFDSTPMLPAPQWTPLPLQYPAFPTPSWEIDIKTERQTFVNGLPSGRETSTSTWGTWDAASPPMMLPSYPPQSWTNLDSFDNQREAFSEEPFEPNYFQFGHEPVSPDRQIEIQVEDCDRRLLDHFLDNVTPFIFSVFDAKQKGSSLADVVLPQLENNPIYLHCCLSTAALHLKVTEHIDREEIDNDIIRHRAETISALCEAFNDETVDPSRLLEATLAMILFQSSIGSSKDGLPDIPWHAHFQAVASLIEKVQEQNPYSEIKVGHAAFNMTMAYWIDILGATALGRVPIFADTYRDKIETTQPSGLAELMGCDDRVMYLISEIACLESLQQTMQMDDVTLCTHITGLGERLGQTEFGPAEMASIYTPESGGLRSRQLSRNITALFRFAARIYLCSLVPDFDRHAVSVMALVDQFTDAMTWMPTGPQAFDRALVWPLIVAGSVSVPASPFRKMFYARATDLGQASEFGSFGCVRELLNHIWHINDEHTAKGEKSGIHWREAMRFKGVDYLII